MSGEIDIHREFYELKGKFEILTDNVAKLTEQVDALNKTLAQGKGAWLVLVGLPTILGGTAAALGYLGIRIAHGQS